MPSHVYLLLAKIFISTSLAGCLAWLAEYSVRRGWRNSVGRTLLAKTLLLSGLLLIALLSSFLRFSPPVLDILRWADLVLLALIGPVMVWRMIVFRRLGGSLATCPGGHVVFSVARFCPQCGLRVRERPGGNTEGEAGA